MNKKNELDTSITTETWICIVCIWVTVFYSVIIQYKFIQIPSGMLILGFTVLGTYIFAHQNEPIIIKRILTRENTWMIWFMVYMLVTGVVLAVDRRGHLIQWVTCCEYLFIQIIIASIIKETGTNTFHLLLLTKAIVLVIVFVRDPVLFASNRYSISTEVNPNGLGMAFATGVWAILLYQQKKKAPLIIVFLLIIAFAYCIILTGSRKALIAAGLSIILWLAFCFFPGLKQKGIVYRIFAVLLLIAIIVVTLQQFISMYSGSLLATRMDRIMDETSEGKRFNMYQVGLRLFKNNPLFGMGFDGFRYAYGTYSHSTLVEIPVSGGVFGAILYFGAYCVSIAKTISLLIRTRRQKSTTDEHTRIRMILILWVVMLFYTTCLIHEYSLESHIIFGMVFGETAYLEERVLAKLGKPPEKKTKSMYFKTHDTMKKSRYIKT